MHTCRPPNANKGILRGMPVTHKITVKTLIPMRARNIFRRIQY
jgi:hypothetical protein